MPTSSSSSMYSLSHPPLLPPLMRAPATCLNASKYVIGVGCDDAHTMAVWQLRDGALVTEKTCQRGEPPMVCESRPVPAAKGKDGRRCARREGIDVTGGAGSGTPVPRDARPMVMRTTRLTCPVPCYWQVYGAVASERTAIGLPSGGGEYYFLTFGNKGHLRFWTLRPEQEKSELRIAASMAVCVALRLVASVCCPNLLLLLQTLAAFTAILCYRAQVSAVLPWHQLTSFFTRRRCVGVGVGGQVQVVPQAQGDALRWLLAFGPRHQWRVERHGVHVRRVPRAACGISDGMPSSLLGQFVAMFPSQRRVGVGSGNASRGDMMMVVAAAQDYWLPPGVDA
jgi:hypothetical protein